MREGGGRLPAVVPVEPTRSSAAAFLLALPLGLLSAVLLGLIALALLEGESRGLLLAVLAGAGWAASTWLLATGARRAGVVLARGCLLGAVEWALVLLVRAPEVVLAASREEPTHFADPGLRLIGRWLAPLVAGAIPIGLGLLCLLGWMTCALLGRRLIDRGD